MGFCIKKGLFQLPETAFNKAYYSLLSKPSVLYLDPNGGLFNPFQLTAS